MLGRPPQVERAAVHAPAARPACRWRRRPAAARAAARAAPATTATRPRRSCSATRRRPRPRRRRRVRGRRRAGARRRRRSPSGSAGALPANMSNIDGEDTLGRPDARARSRPRTAVAGPVADAVEHGDRLVEVEVEDPRPERVALGVGQRADHRDRARGCRHRAAAGRPRCAAAPPTARRRCGPPRGGPGRRAPRGRGPRRRTGRRTGPSGTSRSSTRRTLASSASSFAAPDSTASGRCAYAGSAIAISMSTPALTARAPASVRSAAKPWVTQVAHRVGVADHETLETPRRRAAPR